MRGLLKSKRVSWASDVNLCQVRLFLSEETPSQVGLGAQDHLQAKKSWMLHSTGSSSDDNLPPGFEGTNSSDQLKKELAQIPIIKWKCPPKIVLDPHWKVVAGEESEEVSIQADREQKVLEAIYPRPSAIPPSPAVPLELEGTHLEDHQIPLVPVTPIEEEDVPDSSVASSNFPMISQLPQSLLNPGVLQTSQGNASASTNPPANGNPALGVVPGVEPDVVAAASAAFTAIMRSNEQGNLIDHELLIKILHNPKLIEKLVMDYGTPANTQTSAPNPMSVLMNLSSQTSSSSWSPAASLAASQLGSLPVQNNGIDTDIQPPPPPGHFYPVTNAATATSQPRPPPGIAPPPPPMKDLNYYKSLIQQHGGDRLEAEDQALQQLGSNQHQNHQLSGSNKEQPPLQNFRGRESRPKINKPCIYYNSSRGCKHGANCAFQHDTSYQPRTGIMQDAQSSKRMKLDREITGRT